MEKKKVLVISVILLVLLALGLIIFVVVNGKDNETNKNIDNDNTDKNIEEKIELDDEQQKLFDLLYKYGKEIYEKEEYKNFQKNENDVYYATKEDLSTLGYDISSILEDCDQKTPIIFFDVDNKLLDEYSAEPLQIVLKCNANPENEK